MHAFLALYALWHILGALLCVSTIGKPRRPLSASAAAAAAVVAVAVDIALAAALATAAAGIWR